MTEVAYIDFIKLSIAANLSEHSFSVHIQPTAKRRTIMEGHWFSEDCPESFSESAEGKLPVAVGIQETEGKVGTLKKKR